MVEERGVWSAGMDITASIAPSHHNSPGALRSVRCEIHVPILNVSTSATLILKELHGERNSSLYGGEVRPNVRHVCMVPRTSTTSLM